ncbi:MAG: hypothetical protein IJM18_09645 [Clostridia bacterium]|nr:hypothetical protein [Clostridia bacterium]
MSKKSFVLPTLLSMGGGGDGNVIGGGTGQSGSDAVPMSFNSWLNSTFAGDLINDGTIDQNDYDAWWGALMDAHPDIFTAELYEELNGWEWEE